MWGRRRSTWPVALALAGLLAVSGRAPGLAARGVCDANLCAARGTDEVFLDGFEECSL